MDLFQEARWFFEENDRVTWRNEIIRKSLVKPIIPRFGIMTQYCPAQCAHQIGLRTNTTYAAAHGYDEDYVCRINLMSDIASMEMNYVDVINVRNNSVWNPLFAAGGFPDTTTDPLWVALVER